jgi:hypothetical protein
MTDPVKLSRQAVASFAAKRKPGYEASLIAAAVAADERSVTITRADYDRLREQFALHCGPGCQLRRSLSWFVRDDGKCGCTEYAAEMDRDGPDGCEARIGEIVAHLVEQGAKRSIFLGAVPSAAVTVVVRRAIEAARAEAAASTLATPPPG